MGEPALLNMPPVYERDGYVTYRASALGGCTRMLALARQGYDPLPPPDDMLRVFEEGKRAEQEVWAKGIVKGLAQEFVQLPVSETIRVVGHLDCWEKERISEIKSQSEGEWRPIRESPLWERYKFQLGVYMHATGLPLVVVRVKRGKDGGIVDEAKEEFDVPPVTIGEIRQRVFEVEMMARRDLAEVNCERVEYPCPFYYTHVGRSQEGVRETVDDPAAVVLARQYKNTRLVANIANSRMQASRDALVDYMGDRTKIELSDKTMLTRFKVGAKHVEYERGEYWSLRVTTKKDGKGGSEGEASGDSV